MLEVTESAVKNIKEYLEQQKIDSAIRITMMAGGCAGPSLGLAVDEAKEEDLTLKQDGITFLVEKSLSESCGTITLDFKETTSSCGCGEGGFSITSEKPLAGAGSGCGSCASGSCG